MRDEENERLKREWLKKNKVTKCPPAYLNVPMPQTNMLALVNTLREIDRKYISASARSPQGYFGNR